MRQVYVCAIAALILTGGCRATDEIFFGKLLTGQNGQIHSDDSSPSDSTNPDGEAPLGQTAGLQLERLPDSEKNSIQQAAYRQEPDSERPDLPELLPAPPPTGVEASNLKLEDLEGMAMQNNPAISQAAALVESAQGNWVQVGLLPNPVVGYSGQQLGSGGQAEQQGAYIGQEIVTGRKLRLNREVAAWNVQRAERELEAVRLRVLTDVRIGYYDVMIAQRRRELAAELVKIGEQGAAAAKALFDGEEVSEADPLRARVEADTARILLQNSTNQHVEAWRQLAAVVGMPQLAIQRLEGELKPEDLDLSWQETLQQILRESPEIAAAIADVEAAQWSIERAYAEVVPNIDVQGVVQDDRGTGSTNGNLQVTVPIPIWNRNQGRIRQAQADAVAATRAVDRVALDLQARLAAAFQRYESARNQVEKYSRKDGILDNAQRTLELIRLGYQADEFAVLDLLSAQRTYFQTNLAYLESLRELTVSAIEIRGLLLRGSLQK